MADTGATSSGTVVNDSTIGTSAWVNVNNAKISNNTYAEWIALTFNYSPLDTWNLTKLVIGGNIVGDEIPPVGDYERLPLTEQYVSLGGSSNLWGNTISASDVNANDFGVGISVSDGGLSKSSHYLKATNFGFSIPDGSTIDGVLVEVELIDTYTHPSSIVKVDHIRMTIYYTEGASSDIKTVDGVAIADVKAMGGVAKADIKSRNSIS